MTEEDIYELERENSSLKRDNKQLSKIFIIEGKKLSLNYKFNHWEISDTKGVIAVGVSVLDVLDKI